MAVPKNILLESAYEQLGYADGELISAIDQPSELASSIWVDKGNWLSLASRISKGIKDARIDKVFFVGNNPTIVFGECIDDETVIKNVFQRVWCMARPSLLFLAFPGDLRVYSLNKGPKRDKLGWKGPEPLKIAQSVNEVYKELSEFRREEVETGRLFDGDKIGKIKGRADQQLINDLKVVRTELMKIGLDGEYLKYAHALIGRSIFIRYLEDRGILTEEYFQDVASKNSAWGDLIRTPLEGIYGDPEMQETLYLRVLNDVEFTYALFDRLSHDFNGDMFPRDVNERAIITARHLKKIQGLMCGDTGPQTKLFFWAYKFDVIPTELISSIYEEFYHKESGSKGKKKSGTYYTPSALVEFILSNVLTEDVLEKNPRVLDPACGSGIFLVEAFRRIIRYRVKHQQGIMLSPDELRDILRRQIAGIEKEEEAIRISAFSLCLAFLDHIEPPDIREQIKLGKHLPVLKVYPNESTGDNHFNILLKADTFDIADGIRNESELSWFNAECADVVVGNPPWGDADKIAKQWCAKNKKPIGDNEYSQAFIWRVLELLKNNGTAGLLVSSGVIFKQKPKSQIMRSQWLAEVTLIKVVNFVHARRVFFTGGISPFIYVEFRKGMQPEDDSYLQYWSVKSTAAVQGQQAVVLNRADLHVIKQNSLQNNDKLWKIYWWGSHRDAALIKALSVHATLGEIAKERGWETGYGFQGPREKGHKPAGFLEKYLELPIDMFSKYGPIDERWLKTTPDQVFRRGTQCVYENWRILIKDGVTKGIIVARLEDKKYSFKHSIIGINVANAEDWERKIIIGILWSSLARYYLFYISSQWGTWHDAVYLEHGILKLPICFPKDKSLSEKIVDIVDKMRSHSVFNQGFLYDASKEDQQRVYEEKLDELIYDLYELSDPERDLIRDLCKTGFDYLYNGSKSDASKPLAMQPIQHQGLYRDLPKGRSEQKGLQEYLEAFLHVWNQQFDQKGELWWHHFGLERQSPMVAVVFTTKGIDEGIPESNLSDEEQWNAVLKELSQNSLMPYKTEKIFTEGMVRYVNDMYILIIKRNEQRLWTRSMAFEDAEATMLQAINLSRRNHK